MSLVIENASIVIVAKGHNPSILQPYFLHDKNIIPKEWDWEGARSTLTPPLSQIVFKEGFAITAELQKLVFQENEGERVPDKTKLGAIASAYTKILPHVPYTSVGVNFTGHINKTSTEEASSYLLNRFIAKGKWTNYGKTPPAVGVKFVYDIGDSKCTLSLEPGEVIHVDKPQERIPVVFVSVNYHSDANSQKKDWLSTAIAKWADDFRHFIKMVDELVLSN
jgi:hypothetical protein